MVKIPEYAEHSSDTEAINRRTQFLHDLGLLIHQWNRVELCLELAICRMTGLSNLHCSIMLGSLQHKAKVNILYALLRDAKQTGAISKLKTAMSYAKRNALMHGVFASEDDGSEFVIFHRSIDDRYKVAAHRFTADSFHDHVWKFCNLAGDALEALGLSENDPELKLAMESYSKDARFDWLK